MPPSPPPERPATEVRAHHVLATLQLLGATDAAALARVRARVGAAALAQLEVAPRLAWIPGAIDVLLWRALQAELGDEGVRRLSRALGVRHVRTGPLSGLLEGVVQLFGLTPGTLLRWAPRAISEVHRGVGELRVEELHDGLARLALADLHPSLAGEPWLAAVAGSLEACLEVCGVEGESALEQAGPGRAVILLRWRPGAPPA